MIANIIKQDLYNIEYLPDFSEALNLTVSTISPVLVFFSMTRILDSVLSFSRLDIIPTWYNTTPKVLTFNQQNIT